jgi:hypothetical protein
MTRNAMESMFRSAARSTLPLAVIVANVTQRMQFDSMAGIYAPGTTIVVENDDEATSFIVSRTS